MRGRVGVAIIFISLFFLTGCIEVREEVWLNADGSGRIVVDIGIHNDEIWTGDKPFDEVVRETRQEMEQDLEKKRQMIEKVPGVRKAATSRYYGDIDHFMYDIDLSDLHGITEVYKGIADEQVEDPSEWKIYIEDLGGGNMLFRQVFIGDVDDKGTDITAEVLSSDDSDDKYYSIKLHAPVIVSSNGVIGEGRTVTEWRIPFEMLEPIQPYKIELKAKVRLKPVGHNIFVVLILGIIVLATVSYIMHRKYSQ